MGTFANFVAQQPKLSLPAYQSPAQKVGGVLQGIGSGIIHPLTVAGTKIAQAGVGAVKLPQLNSEISQQQSNTDKMNSLLAQMKQTTDPQKLASLKAQAHALVDASTPNQAAEENNSATLGKLSNTQNVNLPVLGTTAIPAQQSGLTGAKQIAGQGLEDAAYLYGGEGIGALGEGTGVLANAGRGAVICGIVGAGAGAGQEMQQQNNK